MTLFIRIGLLVTLSLGASAASAQTFQPGYLVSSQGDTLRGEIENYFWEEAPTEIRFRPTATGAVTEYKAEQLQLFRFDNGAYYRAALLPIDRQAETRPDLYKVGLVTKQQPARLLAEVLLEGEASLLRVVLNTTPHYFVSRPNREYLELVARGYLQERDGAQHRTVFNNYQGLLRIYFIDCQPIQQLLPNAKFTPEGLAKVVQTYNQQCSAQPQASTKLYQQPATAQKRVSTRLGLVAGAVFSSYRVQDASPATKSGGALEQPLLPGAQLDGRFHPLGGVYADILQPGRRKALHFELTASSFGRSKPQVIAPGSRPTMNPVPNATVDFGGLMATARAGFRVFGNPSQLQPFGGVGVGLNVNLSSRSTLRYGDGQARTAAEGVRVAGESGFDQPWQQLLPYFEAGVRHGRASLALEGRLHLGIGRASFADNMIVREVYRDQRGNITGYGGAAYDTKLMSAALTFGWSLGKLQE
ncbi:hypothetical protein D3Y59_15765 [Hymenobacter oligotrophus]|uniref:PorT family protein n=1 Tax=Hymenobacter oligotrophus TaxID=2319843 RepID=A0A3B7R2S6_9BACT|nr:hypothetical protein [Hymenobacter oligotrophus]AYA38374.1 hypothetical protein D3Y59_15765 [Hymenobacter oligotrophus]